MQLHDISLTVVFPLTVVLVMTLSQYPVSIFILEIESTNRKITESHANKNSFLSPIWDTGKYSEMIEKVTAIIEKRI